MLGFNPDGPSAGALSRPAEKFAYRGQHCLARNDHLCSLDLLMRLHIVAYVRKENAFGLSYEQKAGTARKVAKVSDVRKMAHQQCVNSRGGKMLPEPYLARVKIH